ncbi:TetR/AcrR family transcriptional regulator [Dyella sp. C9]|uniref:TetR/AcrR family transcriptional regulator n=1 Tax=Dyella sp. C9 TaxID=2202154 RepID=UPI000DEFA929|nr:TetR/AcrR family transcriptional regulator [Dyella sp. C9]
MSTKRHRPIESTDTSESKPKAAERIRRTAHELFYREGIRAIGVEEIVSRAGVTKPSLYRSYASKDELAAEYLRDYEVAFWNVFDAGAAAHPGDARAQLMAYFEGLVHRATQADYRGCGLTNAVVEYPGDDHPAREVALQHKSALRSRLAAMSAAMGAKQPELLADGLLLLLEGTYASGQLFGPGGPARSLVEVANQLIDATLR